MTLAFLLPSCFHNLSSFDSKSLLWPCKLDNGLGGPSHRRLIHIMPREQHRHKSSCYNTAGRVKHLENGLKFMLVPYTCVFLFFFFYFLLCPGQLCCLRASSNPAISSLQRGLTGHASSTGRTYRVVHPMGSRERVHMISYGLRDLGIWLYLVSLARSGLLAGGLLLKAKEENL